MSEPVCRAINGPDIAIGQADTLLLRRHGWRIGTVSFEMGAKIIFEVTPDSLDCRILIPAAQIKMLRAELKHVTQDLFKAESGDLVGLA